MKNIIKFIIPALFVSLTITSQALAASEGPESIMNNLRQAGNAAQFNTSKASVGDYVDLVGQIINTFFAIVGVILIGLLLHAGYLWMTARGNEEHVSKAKEEIRDAIIGLIILVGAYAITYFVLGALSGLNKTL